jgi:hypothetical protein
VEGEGEEEKENETEMGRRTVAEEMRLEMGDLVGWWKWRNGRRFAEERAERGCNEKRRGRLRGVRVEGRER